MNNTTGCSGKGKEEVRNSSHDAMMFDDDEFQNLEMSTNLGTFI